MGKSQRQKGAQGEREWCALLRAGLTGAGEVGRVLGQARDGGGDVHTPPILWEVKRYAKFAVYEHMDQALASLSASNQVSGCRIPAVALRGDNREWLVVMRASDAIDLINRANVMEPK